ncbi:hypothetical protein [Cohaesibacter celericrescens]|uniref:EamA domain-containing protein n=1 Tax=Cohaesibacter celericrescens TaxID=2067669 RepID=A0A2N5XLF9_9HYPH|nr:hypothetical protein [Cohaesibacter celericrescens]PLW75349.1 hypothetical protein C0081_19975 [Cohaesibacter celericrescens]
MSIGIAASVVGAFFQALNYAVTQKCQQTGNYRTSQILLATHVAMGVVSIVLFILLRAWQYLDYRDLKALLWINVPYAAAQLFLIIAIQKSGASIVSPLLALKIPTVAALTLLRGGSAPQGHQLIAIVAILTLAAMLSRRSGKLEIAPALLLVGASLGYALSDIEITHFSKQFLGQPIPIQVAITVAINYLFCGVIAVICMAAVKQPLRSAYDAKWIGLTWMLAVYLLVVGFSWSGVLEANVAQSLRGVFGILISMIWLRHAAKGSGDWAFKAIVAVGMTISVYFYFAF